MILQKTADTLFKVIERFWEDKLMNKFIMFSCIAILAGCGKPKLEAPDCPDPGKKEQAVNDDMAPAVWDDGRSTYLRFPAGMEIPGINVLRFDNTERTVNKSFNPNTGVVTIHGIYSTIVLRMGKRLACIRNTAYDPQAPQISSAGGF